MWAARARQISTPSAPGGKPPAGAVSRSQPVPTAVSRRNEIDCHLPVSANPGRKRADVQAAADAIERRCEHPGEDARLGRTDRSRRREHSAAAQHRVDQADREHRLDADPTPRRAEAHRQLHAVAAAGVRIDAGERHRRRTERRELDRPALGQNAQVRSTARAARACHARTRGDDAEIERLRVHRPGPAHSPPTARAAIVVHAAGLAPGAGGRAAGAAVDRTIPLSRSRDLISSNTTDSVCRELAACVKSLASTARPLAALES